MRIELKEAGKRFNRDWIFRNLTHTFEAGSKTVLLGSNGSGKSTLLRVCSAYFSLSEGEMKMLSGNEEISLDKAFEQLSIAAPYLDLPGLFTLKESIDFHFRFKQGYKGISADEVLELTGLTSHKNKQIRNFSSGMKQRLKLALAICTESSVLLLDEPSTNLDAQAIDWYNSLIERMSERTIIVASNHTVSEYGFCSESINIADFKP